MTDANEEHWEPIFADAVRKIAPRSSQIYSKLIMGLQAQADLAVREREDMANELATLKQRKMAEGKFMSSDFWGGFICGVMFIGMTAGAFSFFIERGWIQ